MKDTKGNWNAKTAFLVTKVAWELALHSTLSLRDVGDPEGVHTKMEAGVVQTFGDQKHEMAWFLLMFIANSACMKCIFK